MSIPKTLPIPSIPLTPRQIYFPQTCGDCAPYDFIVACPERANSDRRNHRGKFYRPVKQAVFMRLDADVIAWLKKRGKGYQTRANSILRQRMLDETKRA